MKEERLSLIEETLARQVAERVVTKLVERQKRALVVYTGSNIGVDDALEELRALRADGFSFRIFFTRSAARILDVAAIKAALEPEEVWIDVPEETPEALTKRYDTVLVPALTVNTAAHVASCMADTPGAAIILDGLMRGKNVILARDGCCPENPERARRGFHMAPAMKARLTDNLCALRDYGARICDAAGLAETARQAIVEGIAGAVAGMIPQTQQTTGKEPAPPQPQQLPAAGGSYELALSGRVLSRNHLRKYPPHVTVWVPKGTMVTQFASDEARERDIQIKIKT